ncbi:putative transcriptional regulator, TetR family [Gordonia polyisoprenivorans VH2]|uniref:Putative transcriptional regulator, TetR family n=1 Tax=Gordonia polyisoprenivorans (strain DSM 44266 / VH2) TaxID=1112204 RepID=H6N1D7_GORPV|nr:TetR family transcriptional regulator [Gordonia polyisoprenivorans]AFA72148.1 putative transcriptional regulator, TetR family [Gordonia polyisoprenivorans VH2]
MPPAPSLQRDDIVDTAIRIIERDGVDGLSMRRLASELGSKPMTLYNYVDNKSALLQFVLTEVAARIPWSRPEGPPRERMITVAVDMYNELAAISWIVPILRQGTTIGAPAVVLADTFVSAAIELGIDDVTAMSTWRSVWYIVASELQWQDTLARRRPGEKSWHQTIDPDLLADMPTIARLLPHMVEYSREFRVRDAVAAQIDGVLAHLHD